MKRRNIINLILSFSTLNIINNSIANNNKIIINKSNSHLDNSKSFHKNIMPVLFIGHGSPRNAILDNKFTQSLKLISSNIEKNFKKPSAIVMISAHWLTDNITKIDFSNNPKIIYDFYGFEKELYEVKYPEKGSVIGNPKLAIELNNKFNINQYNTILTQDWGLDHGSWTILKHIYPNNDNNPDNNIPIFQLSIDYSKDSSYHYNLAKELSYLRENGVLIIGSGNIVHNLGILDRYAQRNKLTYATMPWAHELDKDIKHALLEQDIKKLINYQSFKAANFGIETPDHYYPFIYSLGAAHNFTSIKWLYEGFEAGSISMRCVLFS